MALWQGFAFLAAALGLSRLHGAWAIAIMPIHFALFAYWGAVTHFQELAIERHQPGINLSYMILPPGASWLLFGIGIWAMRRKQKSPHR